MDDGCCAVLCPVLCAVLCLQVDMLRPNLLGSFDDFGKRYCLTPNSPAAAAGGARGWRPKYSGFNPSTAAELHRLLMANVMVRRTKGQSGVTLPEKTRLKVNMVWGMGRGCCACVGIV